MDHAPDPEKDRLEKAKLDAEVRELNQKIRSTNAASRSESRKLLVTVIGIVVPLVIGIPTALIQFHNFLDQRHAEQTFEVSRELIELINQLNDPQTVPAMKRAAAISLSLLGDSAIPLLVDNLDTAGERDVFETTIGALEDVLLRQNDPREVLDPVLQAARRTIRRELAKAEPRTLSVRVYAEAVSRLATATRERLDDGRWDEAQNDIAATYSHLNELVRTSPNLQDEEKDQLSNALQDGIGRLVQINQSTPFQDGYVAIVE